MTLKHYDFEAGVDGLAATNVNAGSTQLTLNGGTCIFDAASACTGSLGLKITAPAAADATMRFSADAANTIMSFSVSLQIPAVPPVNMALFTLRNATGVAFRAFVHTNGRLQFDGATQVGQIDTGVALTPNSKFRIEVKATVGTTASNGAVGVTVYTWNQSAPLAAETTNTAFNLGTTPITAADIITSAGRVLLFDDVRFNDGVAQSLGPVPNSKAAANSVRPYDTLANPGAFSVVGGQATPEGALADESDSTYIQSPGAPAGASITIAMDPLTAGPVTVKVRHSQSTDTPSISRKYELVQGSNVIATRTVTLTQAWVDYLFTTTTAETAQISSPRNNLTLRITDTSL